MSDGQGSITYGSAPGSGGGGISSVVEISGVKVTTAAGVASLTNRLLYFFVTQYGATGDGVTDDTVAIQAAFTAAGAAGGGVVFFPKGNYLVSATIVWPAGATIRALGSSGGDVIVNGIISGLANIIATTQISVFQTSGSIDKIENLQFVGVVGATAGNAVTSGSQNFEAINCGFYGFFNAIVLTVNEVTRITRCGFREQNNYGVAMSNSVSADNGDASIIDCVFTCSVATMAAAIYQNGSGGLKVATCKFVSSGNMGIAVHSFFPADGSTSDLLICNCSMEFAMVAGIFVDATGSGTTFYNVSVVGCNISSYANGSGILLDGNGSLVLRDIAIVGNNIGNCTYGISISDASDVIISGNTFSNNSIADVARAGATVVKTGLAGDDNGATPINPAVPAKWADVIIYTAAGPVTYKMALFL
jgi:parallel beta-helix repeat protein